MKNPLSVIAVALVVAWIIGILGFSAGGVIHTLLVIALIIIVIRLIQGKKAN